METEFESMRPEDLELPKDGVVFMFGGEEEVSMAYLGDPKMDDRLRAEAIYKLLSETSAAPKKMNTAVIRGLACLDMRLH